ncbi:similar to Saccharomyces cerevisiae YPR049C ATG11 Adapter protein for pexophagy and the cytoplasm-to-vacuole targeting (Cvt) pathway [Maudiozyma barnettii]|uniref:Autophagy-related protein 11 n=1 Tax=Maudiozyma barnettii TaxID=61262 RepID=A0A8H2ZII2_9SACH|nr:autophagy protein ATG11 [Kazachstania barnettii]CAB4253089.1 similar to Saccharomyces cerevisiae YPR049C ATG11 Adapter protein for pexophagy and the cytoplasm-to-vacuole targeting (Cvt) pathway [Kazachstania barnettii]CAD1780376.1 similar to Saccharomyces cerevisiae YPR049C ATG11 Adapter protein for pexophagy and the cytoplasm-to-vacuole targeting (Cvt) pathway [Kazachstania barnettii]
MSEDTRIINAISGKTISTNIRYFTSYNNLKDFIHIKWGIPTEEILILLPYGTKLKQSTLESYLSFDNSELQTLYQNNNNNNNNIVSSIFLQKEFYVYDRRLFSLVNKPNLISNEKGKYTQTSSLSFSSEKEELILNARQIVKSVVFENILSTELALIRPVPSPLMETNFKGLDSKSYHNIITTLVTNIGWLSALEIDVHYLEQLIKDISKDIVSIIQCLFMADQYLKKYTFDVEELYNSNVSFLGQLSGVKNDSKWVHYYDNILNNLNGLNDEPLQHYINKIKLDNDFETIKELDTKINSDLINIKNDMDVNFQQRNFILENIQNANVNFRPKNDKYELEDEMLLKFNELMDEIKSDSRSILNKKSEEFNVGDIETMVSNTIESNHKSTVSKLYTISQALYTKVEDFLSLKRSLQEQTVIILGQVSYCQIETLKMKKILVNSCNMNLKTYQNTIKQFTQVEDFPIIYGLYIIELYRRNLWLLRTLNDIKSFTHGFSVTTDKERSTRNDWASMYGLVASLFTDNDTGTCDLDRLKEMILSAKFLSEIENVIIPKCQDETKHLFNTINKYLQNLTEVDIITDVHILLKNKLKEINSINASLCDSTAENFKNPDERIKYYRNRVIKLESILHDTYINNSQRWPTGILSSPFCTYGIQNTELSSTSINELPIVLPTDPESKENILSASKEELNRLTRIEEDQRKEINKQNSRVSDLQLENSACRETLHHLNKELLRLTTLQEESENANVDRALEYKTSLEKLIDQNVEYANKVNRLEEESARFKKEHEETTKKQTMKSEEWDLERLQLQRKIDDLKNGKNEIEKGFEQEYLDTNTSNVSVQTSNYEINSSIQPDTEETKNKSFNIELQLQNKNLQNMIFRMFQRNIYILENIGLLLVPKNQDIDDKYDTTAIMSISSENLSIKRVKGLKKSMEKSSVHQNSSKIEASNTALPGKVIQSSVYHTIDKLYHNIDSKKNLMVEEKMLHYIKQIYDSGLYENSVIRRFNDIELLAKKMTKEVKSKKSLIDRYQAEKITVKDFQLGDTALFLPTSDNHPLANGYSISSLNSSFSSIDISTPPPVRNSDDRTNVLTLAKIPDESKTLQPWAAFTAFEKDIKYFYCNKDHPPNLRNEEWFIGKITDMEKNIVTDDSFNNPKTNPYKLSIGIIWYQVKAQIILHPTVD